jgi:hypothetical protein
MWYMSGRESSRENKDEGRDVGGGTCNLDAREQCAIGKRHVPMQDCKCRIGTEQRVRLVSLRDFCRGKDQAMGPMFEWSKTIAPPNCIKAAFSF